MAPTTIPARYGLATNLLADQSIKITNTHGTQVIDTWAFTLTPSKSIQSQLSMQHTRASLNRTIPKVGDGLYNNKREEILTLVEDTTAGYHDTLIAACDEERYIELAGEEGRRHRNCSDNLGEGLRAIGIQPPQFTPSPLNLLMNIPIAEDRVSLSFEKPTSKEGEYVVLKAKVDCVVAFSACPQVSRP